MTVVGIEVDGDDAGGTQAVVAMVYRPQAVEAINAHPENRVKQLGLCGA